MALAAKLQLRQSQGLVMTPQLMQSIRLLQLTHVELDRFVDEEIERNPLLERESAAEASDGAENTDPAGQDRSDWQDGEPVATAAGMAERLDASLENVFPDDPGQSDRVGPSLAETWRSLAAPSDGFDMDDLAGAGPSLADTVREQIAFAFADSTQALIAAELADELDDAGYFRGDAAEIAERLGVEAARVLGVLRVCQGFEPAGLFARDLSECLGLQLRCRDRLDPAMQSLLANLDLLARRDFHALKRLCGVDEEDLLDMLAEIRGLDPKPGLAFTGGTADPIVPDVVVRPRADGGWAIELNPDTLPRVLVNQTYYSEVASHAADQREREFLSECLQSANWLARSLDQRARTILKVATEIVRQQDAFLAYGVRHLRPLNLRTVADAIGMHESTVSRVTSNKYMMTPRGLFELRYFFTVAIASAEGGEAHSSEAVRDRIRQLIDEEAQNVLSDDAIVDTLKRGGIDIARRTVAKYREGMNIPSSVQRRREKRAVAALAR